MVTTPDWLDSGVPDPTLRSVMAWLHRRYPFFCVSSPATGIEYVSPSAEALLGYETNELKGSLLFSLINADDVGGLLGAVDVEQQQSWEARVRVRRADDTWLWFDGGVFRIDDGPLDSPTARFVAVGQLLGDTPTSSHDTAASFQQANLSYAVARVSDRLAHVAGRLHTSDAAVAEMVRSFAVSLSTVAQPLHPEFVGACDLAELLGEVSPLLESLAGDGVTVYIDVDGHDLLVGLSRQAITNLVIALVRNAAASLNDAGEITIAAGLSGPDELSELELMRGPTVQLDVTDTGSGMNIDELRVARALLHGDPAGEHPGQGLRVIGEMARAAAAHVKVESVPRLGTRIVMNLPGQDWDTRISERGAR